jgi:hypothetical protein
MRRALMIISCVLIIPILGVCLLAAFDDYWERKEWPGERMVDQVRDAYLWGFDQPHTGPERAVTRDELVEMFSLQRECVIAKSFAECAAGGPYKKLSTGTGYIWAIVAEHGLVDYNLLSIYIKSPSGKWRSDTYVHPGRHFHKKIMNSSGN